MRRFVLLAGLIASGGVYLLSGCKGNPKGKVEPQTSAGSAGSTGSAGSAAPVVKGEPCKKAELQGPIAWIDDDYASALACAQQKKVPLVLDLWAPWCHTCIAMQTTVFMDASFSKDNTKFVFAALDTDREENAAAVGKFMTSAMPTFYVIGDDEAVLSRFVGAATTDQFHEFLEAGDRAAKGSMPESDAAFVEAERAMAKRDYVAADAALTKVLATAPAAWLRRPEVINYLQMAKRKHGDTAGCLQVSDEHMDDIGQTALATNFWEVAIECADEVAKTDAAKAKAIKDRAVTKLQKTLDDPNAPLSPDDRAEALGYLRDGLEAEGKKPEAKAAAEKAKKFVDEQWTKAATPFARMAWAWPRAEVYDFLGKQLDLVADYEKLAADLPKEYEPRARLGWLYLKAKKAPEAAKWTDEALALVYGPRKARILGQRAEIAQLAGDVAAEKKYREDVVKLWESLPEGQRNDDALVAAKTAYANVGMGSASGSGSAAAGSAK